MWRAFALAVLFIGGCAEMRVSQLPGPADEVKCTIERKDSLTGTYDFTFKGRYTMETPSDAVGL